MILPGTSLLCMAVAPPRGGEMGFHYRRCSFTAIRYVRLRTIDGTGLSEPVPVCFEHQFDGAYLHQPELV